jgi:hypothetical protein
MSCDPLILIGYSYKFVVLSEAKDLLCVDCVSNADEY